MTATLTTLAGFPVDDGGTPGVNGSLPYGDLTIDSNGDLFGTTSFGVGTVFEIAKTSTGYASTPTTFDFSSGARPVAGLIADANGDLFGTTQVGGADGFGTVFEILKTAAGYASTPTTLVSFNEGQRREPRSHPDRRRQRRPVRDESYSAARTGRRHSVRDCQDPRWLREHAQSLWSVSTTTPPAGCPWPASSPTPTATCSGRLPSAATLTATARCSKSSRL